MIGLSLMTAWTQYFLGVLYHPGDGCLILVQDNNETDFSWRFLFFVLYIRRYGEDG